MVEQFVGSWKLVGTNNFTAYLKAIGAPKSLIDAGDNTKPSMKVSQKDGNKMTVDIDNGPPTNTKLQVKYTLGEEYDVKVSDGRNGVKATETFKDNKLVSNQRWDDKEVTISREIVDGKMVATLKYGDIESTRTYQRTA